MSMQHKAYPLDYVRFRVELKPVLEAGLASGDVSELRRFIAANFQFLKDPNEGDPLPASWEALVEPKDVHQYGDLALTKFYDPREDVGLGYDWLGGSDRLGVDDLLDEELGEGQSITLGQPCGFPGNYFDPGQYGSYFQSPDLISR